MMPIISKYRFRRAVGPGALTIVVILLAAWSVDSAEPAPSPSRAEQTRIALHAAVEGNLAYCRQWLDEKDYKSLGQTASGIAILADVLRGQGDAKAWQAATGQLRDAAAKLTAEAGRENADACKAAIDGIDRENQSAKKLDEIGRPVKPSRAAGNLRAMMALLEGTYADAKAALAFGEVEKARQTAYVLAELGRRVAGYQSDTRWAADAGAMSAAAVAVALGESADAKMVREQLRGVYLKCEACHDRRGR